MIGGRVEEIGGAFAGGFLGGVDKEGVGLHDVVVVEVGDDLVTMFEGKRSAFGRFARDKLTLGIGEADFDSLFFETRLKFFGEI